MDSSVTEGAVVLVAIIMAISTALFLGMAESGGWAAEYVGMVSGEGGEDVVENRPKHSSGQTVSLYMSYISCEQFSFLV